jgi:hypothetical protein
MTPIPIPRALTAPRSSFAVPAVAVAGALAFAGWKPGVALSVLDSPRALGLSAAVGVLVLVLGWGLPRVGAPVVVTVLAQAVPVVVAFAVTVLPAFVVVTVDEAAPATARESAPLVPGPPSAATPSPRSGAVGVDARASTLKGIRHRASGRVRVLPVTSGGWVVRLEELDVEPGPDYVVYVVPGAGREDPDGGTLLARLKGARGNQNYQVPRATQLVGPVTVLIWCRAFSVPVAAGTVT